MVVLVQDRTKHILGPVAEENARRLGVHISPHPVVALQYRFQHRIGVRGLRIQFDQLRAHLVCRAHRSLIQHPAAAAGAFRRQPSAKACALHLSGFQFSVSLQPCQLQRFPSAVLCQHVIGVHSKAAHALRQLHSLVKGVHIFHLSQPVQAAGCSRIPPGISNFCRHIPADGRTCPIRYLPSSQLLLHLPLFRGQALLCQAIGLPHPAGLCRFTAFHTFPGVLRDSLLHRRAFSLYLLYCPITGIGLRFVQSLSFGECRLRVLFRYRLLFCNSRIFTRRRHALRGLLLCCHFPQYLPGLCDRLRKLDSVFLCKRCALCFIFCVWGKQVDGLAGQASVCHGRGQLLHRRALSAHNGGCVLHTDRVIRPGFFVIGKAGFVIACHFPFRPHGFLLEGAAARRRLKEFASRFLCPQLIPRSLLHGVSGGSRVPARRRIQRRAHLSKPCAHSAAQRAGCAAGQAAFHCIQEGLLRKHALRRFAVAQCSVNCFVRVGLHKGLHGVVHTARDRIRNRRVLLRKPAIRCHAAHHVGQLSRQCVLGIVAAHGSGKVSCAHAVDCPACAKLCKASGQRLARALAFLNALPHGFRAALGAQHRQHQRWVDARYCKVFACAAHNAQRLLLNGAKSRLRRGGQILSALVQLVTKALLRVNTVMHFRSCNARPHVVDLLPGVSL